MKKGLFTLAVLVMAFGNVGFAQSKVNLKSDATQNVLKHYGVRDETTVVPQTATWHTIDGEKYRTTYTYDEYDYYLTEEFSEIDEGDGWRDFYQITYEYDFAGNVIEALGMSAYETGALENDAFASYTYENGELSEVIYQYWDGNDWVNDIKEVYNYNGDVSTVLYWEWNGSNWYSSDLYTYTRSGNTIELLMQYMQGGAWQNEEKDTFTLDFDENVTEILYELWQNNVWANFVKVIYHYNDEDCFDSKLIQGWMVNSSVWEDDIICSFSYVDGNAVHGEAMKVVGGIVCDEELEMAYGYNAATKTFYGSEVDITYVDLTGVNENNQGNFKVYPVPAENEIQIQAERFQKAEIYSLTGQKMMESVQETMNVSQLASGVYLLKVYNLDGNSETQRIVVK
jgi:hypothetical protein